MSVAIILSVSFVDGYQVVTKRECEVKKREEDVLVLQEKLEKKESVSIYCSLSV